MPIALSFFYAHRIIAVIFVIVTLHFAVLSLANVLADVVQGYCCFLCDETVYLQL